MEVVAVERELGSGQGDIITRTPNSKYRISSNSFRPRSVAALE